MSNKSFVTISTKECLRVYKEILKNSDRKWESGKKLAEIQEFGGAISLAIISNEELIKALIIFFDGNGFNFRNIKGINTLFKNHQLRYLVAYAMFAIGSFGDDIVKLIEGLRKNPQLIEAIIKNYKEDKTQFKNWIFDYLEKKLNSLAEEFDWFSRIDMFRQDGFYCDYKNQLKNPIEISENEYQQAILRLKIVRRFGNSIIESINSQNPDMMKRLNDLKINFIKNDYYGKIADALTSLKIKRESPFEIIKRYVLKNVDTKDILGSIRPSP